MAGADIEIEGRRLRLTNLTKVLWPAVGMTKGGMIGYYARVAGALLPHIAGHPLTLHRFPDGVEAPHWYGTRAPPHPPWVRTQQMYVFSSGKDVRAAVVDDVAGLVWAANTGAIELHPYLATAEDLRRPTALVVDLDPGPPAGLVDAAEVALAARALLEADGLASFPKASGGRGLHVYVPVNGPCTYDATKAFARALARRLVDRSPDRVVDVMGRSRRAGKVLVDWSQNDAGKSTVAPYSLRGLRYPTVSLPVTWDEVAATATTGAIGQLVFLAEDVPDRLDRFGDLFAPVATLTQVLPG